MWSESFRDLHRPYRMEVPVGRRGMGGRNGWWRIIVVDYYLGKLGLERKRGGGGFLGRNGERWWWDF